MVAIVTGNGVGLGKSSSEVLGQGGQLGLGQLPGAAGNAYVNAATGNLIIQRQDELLIGRGPDIGVYQTYNSQGTFDFDNNDNWQVSLYRQLSGLTGTVNTAGSTITRTGADGTPLVYTYDSTTGSATLGKYVNKDGSGSFDTLTYTSGSNTWVWQDGNSRIKESYSVDPTDSTKWRITSVTDLDNNSLTYTYSSTSGLTTLIDKVTSANGEVTQLIYNATKQLTQINVINSSSVTTTRIRYTYESTASTARLTSVSTDLTPADGSINDNNTYTTTYTYDGTSKRIASITNSDGSKVSFTYETSGSFRLLTINDYVTNSSTINNTTTLNYTSATTTTVTNTNNAGTSLVTTLTYDTNKQLTNVQGPSGSGQNVSYTYNSNGDVTQVTDSRGNWTKYTYDAQGNQLTQQDNLGNTVVRTYDSTATGFNQLLTETVYTGVDATPGDATIAGTGTAQTTRYTYDSKNHVRFTISAEGRVTEYRYNATNGQLTSTHQYTDNLFTNTGNQTEAQVNTWLTAAIKSKSQRTDYLYDARGQLSEQVVYTKVDSTTGNEGDGIADGTQMRTQYIYDQSGNLKQKIDARGVATTGTANDYLTSYSYDGLNRLTLTKQYDAAGTEAAAVSTQVTYTDASRQVKLTLANGLVTTSTYDLAGRLLTVQKSDSVNATAGSLGTVSYAYDKLNNLRMVNDELGNVTYYLYDSANRKVGEIDENKNLTEWVYNNNGQVIRTIQYKNTVTATLDASTALTNTITTAGIRPAADTTNDRTSYRVYDQAGRLSHEIDALGYVSEYQYDGASRLLRAVEYNTVISAANLDLIKGSSTDIYGINGSIKGISGIATTNTLALTADTTNDRANRNLYDNDGKLVGSLDAEGYLTEYIYDKAGRQIQKVRYATVTTSTNWATGNLATLKANATAVSGDTPKHQTTNFIYDTAGQLTGVVDAENFLTEYQYDLVGNKTQEIRYATSITYVAGNTVVQSRPASNNEDQKVTNTYDANNRILSTLSNTQGQVNGLLTNYSYDNVGNLTQAVKTFTGATSSQQRVQRSQYDSRGNLIAELSGEGVVALLALGSTPTQAQIDTVWNTYGTRYSYDLGGRLISKIEPNGTSATGNKTLYYYDNEGKLTYTINALGEVNQTVYNSFDQVAETRRYNTRIASATLSGLTGGADTAVASAITGISAGGYSNVQVGYDKRGQAISTTDELNNINSRTYNAFGELNNRTDKIDGSTNVVTSYQYDRKGLLKTTTEDAAGINRITQAIYDAFGRVTQTTDGRNNTQQYQYDRLGREVVVIDGLSKQVTTTYDAFSRVLKRIDRNNTTAGTTNGVTYTYNSVARTMTMTTAENISVVTTSNEFGEVVQVADGRGSITKYSYNTNGQLLQTVEDSGSGKLNLTSGTTYDTAGRVWKTTDAKGTVTQYSYDPTNRVLSKAVDPTGLNLTSNYRYDAQGRQIWAQDAKNIWTRMDYDKKGQLTKVVTDPTTVPTTDANGVVTGTTANAAGLNLTTSYTYNARGKKMTVIEGDGTASARTTQYVYDKLGRLTSSVVDPGTNKLNLTTSYTYDKNDNVVLKTDANGNKTVYTYDANDRLEYTVDALGYITKNEYDANGNIVKARAYKTALAPATLTTLQGAPATTAVTPTELGDDRVTRYGYDKDNRLTYTTNAEWFVTRNEYDANGNVVKRTSYVNKATAISETGGAPTVAANTTTDRVEQTVYDAANRATYSIDALNYVTANSYDANGNVVSATRYANAMVGTLTTNTPPQILAAAGSGNYIVTSSNDQVTRYSYDKADRRTFSMEANGSVTQYDYDKLGQTLKVTRYANAMVGTPAVGGAPSIVTSAPGSGNYILKDITKDQVVEQKFDAAGRKTEAIDAEGKSTKTEYNAAGDIVKVTDALNNVGYFYTDAAGRVTLQVDPEGAVTQTQYDGLGNATQVLRFANKVKTIGTATLSTSASIQIVSTAPTSGNSVYVVSDTAKDQKQTTEYDKLGQAITVKTWTGLTSGTATTDYYAESTTYGAFGEALTQTARNGLVTTYTYDKQSRKTSESFGGITVRNAANNGTVTLKNSYTYNAFGNLLSKVEADGALTTRTTSYANDRLGRQVTATQSVQTTTGTSASAITQKTYDARGNLVAEKDANNNWTYTYYDKQDRRTASVKADGSYTTWTYDALGNISQQTQYANKVQVSGTGTLSATSNIQLAAAAPGGNAVYLLTDATNDRTILYTYDKVGRQTGTEIQNITTGVYNTASSQYQVSTGSITTKNEYDALGNIIKQTDGNGNVTRSWYNKAGQIVAKLDPENYLTVWTRDVYGNIAQETRYANKVQTVGTATYTDSGIPTIVTTAPTTGNSVYVLQDSTNDRTTAINYDKLNRVSSETINNVQAGSVNATTGALTTPTAVNATTSYVYDGLNNILQKTDATSAITNWVYDGLGRQLSEINPQFTDYEGSTVRSRTDKEYDGLNNVTRELRRGKDNTAASTLSGQVETDDQITTYTYGVGGRLTSEKDATDAETQYEYDLNGNITKQTLKNRRTADQVINNQAGTDDVTTYSYDSLNRQTRTTDLGTTVVQEVQYNSFNQIEQKRTYTTNITPTTWDEYSQYDKTGRVWKSNSGDGVTKVYINDKNGNATASISGTLNMQAMTLTQVLAQKQLDTQNNVAPQTMYTFSVYDKRSQLVTTVQPSMDGSNDSASIQINTTGQSIFGANPTVIDIGSVAAPVVTSNPVTGGKLAIVGGTKTYTVADRSVGIMTTDGYYSGYTYQIANIGGFPDTSAYGDGSLRVEVTWYNKYVNSTTGAVIGPVIPPGSVVVGQNDAAQFATPAYYTGVSYPYLYDIIVKVFKVMNGQGEIQVAGNYIAAHGYVSAPVTSNPVYAPAKKIIISGQPENTSKLLLAYRPTGTSGPYQVFELPKLINTTGNPIAGSYYAGIDAWTSSSNYEIQYISLDASGNVINQQAGTVDLSNPSSPAVSLQTGIPIGGAGRAFISSPAGTGLVTNGLQIIDQGSTANTLTLRYRVKNSGSAWSTIASTNFSMAGVGWFSLGTSNLGVFANSSEYELDLEVRDVSGNLVRRSSGELSRDASGNILVGALTTYNSDLRFTEVSGAATLRIGYRATGSSAAYTYINDLAPVNGSTFNWDAALLVPNKGQSYSYDVDIQAFDANGLLINHNQATLSLGVNMTISSMTPIAVPKVLRISPPQSGVNSIAFSYRIKGSTNSYTTMAAVAYTIGSTKEFRVTIPLDLASNIYEYQYTTYASSNGTGTSLGTNVGEFTVSATENSANRLDWVIASSPSSVTISRNQSYNAFGEVSQSIDGRGYATDYTYNTMGKVIAKKDPKTDINLANGFVVTASEATRPLTTYTYDAVGRLIAEKDANANLNDSMGLGGPLSVINTRSYLPGTEQVSLERHADGGLMSSKFDIFGNKRQESNEISAITDYTYDKANRLIRIDRPQRLDGSPSDTNTTAGIGSRAYDIYSYDVAGNRISHTNALGNTEKTFYDSLGRITQTVSFNGFTTGFSYTYSNVLTGLGGQTTAGWVKTTTNTVGRTSIDRLDMFNRLTWHQDLGGNQVNYTYNYGGWLTNQSSTGGQNIEYGYYANGMIRYQWDKAVGSYTKYEYDAEGNKVFEGYSTLKTPGDLNGGVKDFYQQARITYDALNRIQTIVDPRMTINYTYDAVGNRRRVNTQYRNSIGGAITEQNYWYAYDAMNRITLSMGQLTVASTGATSGIATTATDTSIVVGKGAAGTIASPNANNAVAISYNLAGQRVQVSNARDNTLESYTYTADGYLEDIKVDNVLRTRRVNDALGRVTNFTTYNTGGVQDYIRTTIYDADSRVMKEEGTDGPFTYSYYSNATDSASQAATIVNGVVTGNAGAGELANTETSQGGTTVNTYYTYQYWDEAKQKAITAQPYNAAAPNWKAGFSDMRYDVNGNLVSAFDNGAFRALRYVTDGQGRILQREESKGSRASRTQYYYLNGVRVGEISNDGPSRTDYSQALAKGQASTQPNYSQTIWTASNSADFDQNYEPISPRTAGVATTYTVNSGDTLQIIAQRVWGDSAMWYLIADANGLSNANSLIAGQVLTIPNKITNIHNNSGTYRVYNAAEAQGNLLPTIPDAPPPPAVAAKKKKKGGCGGFAGILVAVVAIVATIYTAGAAAAAMGVTGASSATIGSTMAAGMAALGGSSMAAAAIGGAVGSIAGQLAGNALGVQDGFSWSAVATAGLTAGLLSSAPLQGLTQTVGNAVGNGYAAVAARSMLGNVVNQGIGNITGSQKGFSWSSVAISGIGAAAGAALTDQFKLTSNYGAKINGTDFGADLGRAATSAGAFALTQLTVSGGKVNWQQVATDTVTNLIQNRARSFATDKQNELIKKVTATATREDPALRTYYANLAYAETNKPIGGMVSTSPTKGGLTLAVAAANANDEVVAAALARQAEQTIPLLFTTLAKDGGSAGLPLAAQAGLAAARSGGLYVDVTGSPPRDVVAEITTVNAANKAAKLSDDGIAIKLAQDKLAQQQTLASRAMSSKLTKLNNWDGSTISRSQSHVVDFDLTGIGNFVGNQLSRFNKVDGLNVNPFNDRILSPKEVNELGIDGIVGVAGLLFTPEIRSVGAGRNILVDAKSIRWTQESVSYAKTATPYRMSYNLDELALQFKANPNAIPAIDVVRMPDGILTSLDNSRLTVRAAQGGTIKVNIHEFSDVIGDAKFADRFANEGLAPVTYGDAVTNRISGQSAGFARITKYGSTTPPKITGAPAGWQIPFSL